MKESNTELVLKQIDTIIEKYSPERGEKFFSNDIYTYLITVGASFCIKEYYQISPELAEKLKNAFCKEAQWYKKHCEYYCKATIIHERLKKLRERSKKILQPPKQTQAQINAEFQKTVLERLENLENNIKSLHYIMGNRIWNTIV